MNLILVTLDTVRADRLGIYGYAPARTPTIDLLAREGVRFENGVSAAPLTLPAHATILSGLNPQHHGVRNNGEGAFPEDLPTLATHLSARGYQTAAFIGSFVLDHRFGLARGFGTYDDEVDRSPDKGSILEAERRADKVIDRASRWVQTQKGDFFLWVHLYDAHAPYAPPDPFRASFDPYDGEIAYLDSQLARLVEVVNAGELRHRTVIAVVADHGEGLGDHGETTHGLLLYEPTVRVPIIVNAPHLRKGGTVQTPVGLADLAPTLGTLIGVPFEPNEARRGRDLAPDLLAGKEPATREILAETHYPAMFGWSSLASIRRGSSKYIQSPRPELYDVERDRGERKNLLEQDRRTSHELRTALAAARRESRPTSTLKIDAESAAKLASLGYVTSTSVRDATGGRDPMSMLPLFREFEQANLLLAAGDERNARTRLESLVRADPKNPVFRSSLAKVLRQRGDGMRALTLQREAVALAPDDPEAWYNLGAALEEAGQYEESELALRQVLRIDPLRAEARNMLGVVNVAKGEIDRAVEEFQAATRIDSRNAEAFNNLGNVFRARARLEEAQKAYRRAVEIAPSYGDPLNGLGTIAVQQNRPQAALDFFDRALSAEPKLHQARLNRAISLEVMGRKNEAVDAYREFLNAVDGDARFATERVTARNLMKRLTATSEVNVHGAGK